MPELLVYLKRLQPAPPKSSGGFVDGIQQRLAPRHRRPRFDEQARVPCASQYRDLPCEDHVQ